MSDPDHDGIDNYAEFIADTIPKNAVSAFRILSVANAPAFSVSYQSSAFRQYTLYHTTNQASDVWTAVPSQIAILGSGGIDILTDLAPADAQSHYRVGAQLR